MKKILIGLGIGLGAIFLLLFILAALIDNGIINPVEPAPKQTNLSNPKSSESIIIIHSSKDKENNSERIIYQKGKSYYSAVVLSGNDTTKPISLIPDKKNGGDIYKYLIVEGIDSGSYFHIDRFMKTFESIDGEKGSSIRKTPLND